MPHQLPRVIPLLAALLAASSVRLSPGSSPTPPARQPSGGVKDEGIFSLSVEGKKVGTEKFEIQSSGDRIEAKAEIQLRLDRDGKTVELKAFPDLVLDVQFHPLTYKWSQKGSQSSRLDIDFRSSPAKCRYRTVTGQEDNRDFDLPRDVVVVDATSVIHHYQLLVSRFKLAAGPKQTFRAFIPQEAWPTVLTVEERGPEAVELQGHSQTLDHIVVATESTPIDLWVDEAGRLQRLSNPEAKFEAVREK